MLHIYIYIYIYDISSLRVYKHRASGWEAIYMVHVLAGGARRCEVDKCCDCDVSCCDVIMFEVSYV